MILKVQLEIDEKNINFKNKTAHLNHNLSHFLLIGLQLSIVPICLFDIKQSVLNLCSEFKVCDGEYFSTLTEMDPVVIIQRSGIFKGRTYVKNPQGGDNPIQC